MDVVVLGPCAEKRERGALKTVRYILPGVCIITLLIGLHGSGGGSGVGQSPSDPDALFHAFHQAR